MEFGDIGNQAEEELLTPIECLCWYIAKPNLMVGTKVLARDLHHGNVTSTIGTDAGDDGDRGDGMVGGWWDLRCQCFGDTGVVTQTGELEPPILRPISADDGPGGGVVDRLPVRVIVAAHRLMLNDPVLRQTEIHPVRVLQVEGTLVQLAYWVIRIQHHHCLVHLSNNLQNNAAYDNVDNFFF